MRLLPSSNSIFIPATHKGKNIKLLKEGQMKINWGKIFCLLGFHEWKKRKGVEPLEILMCGKCGRIYIGKYLNRL